MEFRILGPLGASAGERTLTLGGFKQRAVLALLLLRANRVVATSELLRALWPEEERPATARKIVQNAVWGLRALLAEQHAEGSEPSPELVTQAPGYVLRLDPDRVDLHRFDRRVAEGRARLAAGEPEEAARLLGEALGEWQGPALADLAEEGIDWPELTALRQLRLDVMEDRFEAELRSGHHHSVLGELVALVEEEPLRERLCGQLMLALYRCGRQAEALSVFSRVRRALVEEYGLEPSRELQLLQQNILTHDPALVPRTERTPRETALATVRTLHERPSSRRVPEQADPRPADLPVATASPVPSPEPSPLPDGAPVAERRPVTVLLVRTGFAGESQAFKAPAAALSLHDAVTAVAECVEEFGGTVAGSLGYVSVALFGLRTGRSGASLDAVRAALAVRDRLGALPGPASHAVVTAGDALVRRDAHDPTTSVSVAGRLVDEARSLLATVPPGEIHLCGDAVGATEGTVRQVPVGQPGARSGTRRVEGLYPAGGSAAAPADPSGGHDTELTILRRLLERSRRHDAPHLMTILGDADVGKTRFLADFERCVSGEPVRVVRMRSSDGALWMARDVLMASCGLAASAPANQRLTEVVRRLAGHGETAERLLRCLGPLLGHAGLVGDIRGVLDSWCELLVLLAREQPLVLCLDDAHRAEDAVLDCLERLASTTQEVPLFMVACARPELLERRPFWGSGLRHSGTLTLDRIPDPGREPAGPVPLGSVASRA